MCTPRAIRFSFLVLLAACLAGNTASGQRFVGPPKPPGLPTTPGTTPPKLSAPPKLAPTAPVTPRVGSHAPGYHSNNPAPATGSHSHTPAVTGSKSFQQPNADRQKPSVLPKVGGPPSKRSSRSLEVGGPPPKPTESGSGDGGGDDNDDSQNGPSASADDDENRESRWKQIKDAASTWISRQPTWLLIVLSVVLVLIVLSAVGWLLDL